jgi:hypothetical protein
MIINSKIRTEKPAVITVAIILACVAWSCRFEKRGVADERERDGGESATDGTKDGGITGGDDDSAVTGGKSEKTVTGGAGGWEITGGTGGPVTTGGTRRPVYTGPESGGAGGDSEVLTECPIADPPLPDPFCYNVICPLANLSTISDANKPMGDCCNTVDVRRMEESMPAGARYDLELAIFVNISQNNPNVANEIIQGLIQNSQLSGADITLLRFKQVPRTADMTGPVSVTLEMNSGKLNCDGTYSFYGPNGASEPVHDGPPNDPGRWAKRTLQLDYYGHKAERLVEMPEEDAIVQAVGLSWVPRWKANSLDYEQSLKFLSFVLENDPNNWSCYGSMDSNEEWTLSAKLMLFVPIEEAELTLLPDLGMQSQCGLLAKGPLQGDCDDAQEAWPTKPTGYCDSEGRCWIGDVSDRDYEDFWRELYPGEDGCGPAHPCCDPAGLSDSLEPCNAFFIRNAAAVAAVDITDEEINDPDEANSYRTNCE